MNIYEKMLVAILAAITVIIIGCGAVVDLATPAYISQEVIEYSHALPKLWEWQPYTSLWDLRRVHRAVDHRHLMMQKAFERCKEDDIYEFNRVINSITISTKGAEELKDSMFNPTTGALSLLLAGSGFGLGSYLIKRPSDGKKIKELEGKVNGVV